VKVKISNDGAQWIKVCDSPFKPGVKVAPGAVGEFETDALSAFILENVPEEVDVHHGA
jgi:hypothetical protein